MKESNAFIFTLALLLIVFDGSKQCFAQITDEAADHSQWTVLLKKHVRANGLVDYKGFISDQKDLNEYIRYLSNNPPVDSWSDADQIAYWINAYNAFTIKLIADNYPVESIKDLNPRLSIPTVRSIWTKEWFQMGGEDFSLDRIEHKILRKTFKSQEFTLQLTALQYHVQY